MALGTARRHQMWDDTVAGLGRSGDRAHDLYDEGRSHAADLYRSGRDRAGDVYGETRHRLAGAADALAGRRSLDTGPIVTAAVLGIAAGAAMVVGVLWWLRRLNDDRVTVARVAEDEAGGDAIDELIANGGAVTSAVVTDPR